MSLEDPRTPLALGGRLQALRKAHRLTLDRLAQASGVSKSMLSQIERGRVNPTVATLWNLSGALGVEIGDLLGGGTAQDPAAARLEHVKAHGTPTITSADGLCRLRILSPPRSAQTIEWYEIAVEPGGELRSEPHAAGTREHLTLLQDCLAVELPGAGGPTTSTLVAEGETLRYAADQSHAIVNREAKPARALLVVEFAAMDQDRY